MSRRGPAAWLALGLAAACLSDSRAAEETVCASVKMELSQEATLERQAFDAKMVLRNGLSGVSLEDVSVTVFFLDKDENPVLASSNPADLSARFFITLDSLSNISDVSGNGTVAPETSAEIHWLIIPAPGAAAPSGSLYFVGADLTYTMGGEEKNVRVSPDFITVRPLPLLALDYFMPQEVYGDDLLTATVTEPSILFPLGVRVRNVGNGPAQALKIESAQPKIIENTQGLLASFQIQGCDVNGASCPLSLLADFGTVPPGGAGVARWRMTSSLSGTFSNFSARTTHADALGGELTSLLSSVTPHWLVKDVLSDLPGRDLLPDFLADDGGELRLYDSAGADVAVADRSPGASLSSVGGGAYLLTVAPSTGPFIVTSTDPFSGGKSIDRVFRLDGKELRPENAWLSKTRVGLGPWSHRFHLFDAASAGSYSVYFKESGMGPPEFDPIADQAGLEGQPIEFQVSATDPGGGIVTLSAVALPVGASFNAATGLFTWTPAAGQAGPYEVTFRASNGLLVSEEPVAIQVRVEDDDFQFLTTPPAWSADATPSWSWTPSPGAWGYLCSVDGAGETFVTTTSFTSAALYDGQHLFSVRAQYGATAFGALRTDAFGVDTSSPTLWSVSLNGGVTGTTHTVVSLSLSHDSDGVGSGVAGWEASVDGGAFTAASGTVTLPSVYGLHKVSVRVKDNLNHVSQPQTSAIAFTHALHTLTGGSATGNTAHLEDLSGLISSSLPVVSGSFTFTAVPPGLYGLRVEGALGSKGHPERISLREGLSRDVGVVEPGASTCTVSGQLTPALENVRVEAGLNLGHGHFLPLAGALSDGSGAYALSGLPPGLLAVRAFPPAGEGVGETLGFVTASTAPAVLNLALPAAQSVSGTSTQPGFRLQARDAQGRASFLPVDGAGNYAVALATGIHVLTGRSGFHGLLPSTVSVGGTPVVRNLSLAPLGFSTAGAVLEAGRVLVTTETGVSRSFQVGLLSAHMSEAPDAVPLYTPLAEEVQGSASTQTFRYHWPSSQADLYLLSHDPSRDAHAVNAVARTTETGNGFRLSGAGFRVKGRILDGGGAPVPKALVSLRDVTGKVLGLAEAGTDGVYFFKNARPGPRYCLAVYNASGGIISGGGPGQPLEAQTLENIDIALVHGMRIINYPAAVPVGGTATVSLTWSGVNPAVYALAILIGNGNDISVPAYFDFPAPQGVASLPVNIPSGTPLGNAFIYAVAYHKTSGWGGRIYDALTASDAITLTSP